MSPPPPELRLLFPPSPEELFIDARSHVDSSQLDEIANADYGWKAQEVLLDLQLIAGRGKFPAEFSFQLQEILQLTRFADPDRNTATGAIGHRARFFACTVFMVADADPGVSLNDDSPDSTLASAVWSAHALGPDAMYSLGRFLTWRAANASESESLLTAVSLLFLAICQPPGRSMPFLESLADWVLSMEASIQEQRRLRGGSESPPLPFSIQQGFWRPVESAFRTTASGRYSATLKEKLQLCALILDSGWKLPSITTI